VDGTVYTRWLLQGLLHECIADFLYPPKEREVKKATRDLNQLLNNIESPLTRLDTVQKKYTELLADMKKLDRDYAKSKKRADQLQKDQDKAKSEFNKTATMKDKLEKLCRELTKENKKVKVCNALGRIFGCQSDILCRMRTSGWMIQRKEHVVR
jgi:predicted RNase H-like nuclease (RuvC/YqgF family)